MRISVDKLHLAIKFTHLIKDTSEYGCPATICDIAVLEKPDADLDDTIDSFIGRAYLHPADKFFVKAKGRKYSLRKALCDLCADIDRELLPSKMSLKELRREIWSQYHTHSPFKKGNNRGSQSNSSCGGKAVCACDRTDR